MALLLPLLFAPLLFLFALLLFLLGFPLLRNHAGFRKSELARQLRFTSTILC